jgi:3-hydroxyisobutyrate dehydrogenase
MATTLKVGFIGTGTMGIGMALNLLRAGQALVAYDLHKANQQELTAAGALWMDSVAEIGRASDVVFTSLPGPKEVKDVGLGHGGLIASMRPGSTWFDLSTNSTSMVREISRQFADMGIAMLDAPVSGGPAGARSGKLALYIGGERGAFERHKPLLDSMGDRVIYVGAIGAGSTAKIVHNLIALTTRMAVAEGMSLGIKAGLDPVELWNAVRQGAIGRSRTLDTLAEKYLCATYDEPTFALRLAYKDFNLAMDLAQECNVPMPIGDVAHQDYRSAMERGWSERDSKIPMNLQNERAGIEVKASAEALKRMLARD